MTEASKYLRLLQKHSPNSLETHLLSFEVNMRKQKFLLAFQVNNLSYSSLDLIYHVSIIYFVQVIEGICCLIFQSLGCQAIA